MKPFVFTVFCLFSLFYFQCCAQTSKVITGAERFDIYKPLLTGKNIGLVVNQTSIVNDRHLVDFLLQKKIKITKILAPEHGFRGNIDRGKEFADQTDSATGIKIVSIYGKNKKPTKEQLSDIDLIIYDIQDAGVRFFTYISTLHYVMEACAENNKKLVVLDRPDPNGDYIDGPVLDLKFRSFVGMHPIPVVYGLTPGELARMINGEKWLKDSLICDLEVISLLNYTHKTKYSLPVRPSPNLPNDLSIRLYPSLCFFEATDFSVGRGTLFPFQVIGYPDNKYGDFSFMPVDMQGMQVDPLHENKTCFGIDLRKEDLVPGFTLKYFIEFYKKSGMGEKFFSNPKFFNLLAGNDQLSKQILSGMNENEIILTWKYDLERYKQMRSKYLIYKE